MLSCLEVLYNFKLSYESIEKAEILNKYVCSISNLNDENKVLPDFDCRCFNLYLSFLNMLSCLEVLSISTSLCFVHLQSLLKITPKCLCIISKKEKHSSIYNQNPAKPYFHRLNLILAT
jgi:hypothetical protein